MTNFFDYLDQRGDLSFDTDSFNDIDGLLLSNLSYANLKEIVPGPGEGEITMREAAEKFHLLYPDQKIAKDKTLIRFAPYVLFKLAESERFGGAVLKNFVECIDTENMQFAVLEIDTGDHIPFLSYRGTDDTLAGWKEAFQLSYMTTPAEKLSVEYLTTSLRDRTEQFRIGGYSKGGHLAVYAAIMCPPETREKILEIYDFDSPGFNEEFLETCPDYSDLVPRIKRSVPQDSTIGMLLQTLTTPTICTSSGIGVMQHDPTTWEVQGADFVKKEQFGRIGVLMRDTFDRWIGDASIEDRQHFVDDLFDVLSASGVQQFTSFREIGLSDLANMRRALGQTTPAFRGVIKNLLRVFLSEVTVDISKWFPL